MKSIVLRNLTGDHLGFVLCAVPEGQRTGDCVFMILPKRKELFDSPDVVELFARKDLGESRIQISDDRRSVNIQSVAMDDMYIEFDESGNGVWGYRRDDGQQQVGLALLPPKK